MTPPDERRLLTRTQRPRVLPDSRGIGARSPRRPCRPEPAGLVPRDLRPSSCITPSSCAPPLRHHRAPRASEADVREPERARRILRPRHPGAGTPRRPSTCARPRPSAAFHRHLPRPTPLLACAPALRQATAVPRAGARPPSGLRPPLLHARGYISRIHWVCEVIQRRRPLAAPRSPRLGPPGVRAQLRDRVSIRAGRAPRGLPSLAPGKSGGAVLRRR